MEHGEPWVDVIAMARLFDVLEATRAFAALLVGRVLLALVRAIGRIEQKKLDQRWVRIGYSSS
jgi:hypothetical protein